MRRVTENGSRTLSRDRKSASGEEQVRDILSEVASSRPQTVQQGLIVWLKGSINRLTLALDRCSTWT